MHNHVKILLLILGIIHHCQGIIPKELPHYGSTPSPYATTPSSYAPTPTPYVPTASPYATTPSPYSPAASPYSPAVSPYSPSASPYSPSASPYSPAVSPYSPASSPYAPEVSQYTPTQQYPYDPSYLKSIFPKHYVNALYPTGYMPYIPSYPYDYQPQTEVPSQSLLYHRHPLISSTQYPEQNQYPVSTYPESYYHPYLGLIPGAAKYQDNKPLKSLCGHQNRYTKPLSSLFGNKFAQQDNKFLLPQKLDSLFKPSGYSTHDENQYQ